MSGLLGAGLGLLAVVVLAALLLSVLLLQLQIEGRAVRLRPWVVWLLGACGVLGVVLALVGVGMAVAS